jgi:hypothetical protein
MDSPPSQSSSDKKPEEVIVAEVERLTATKICKSTANESTEHAHNNLENNNAIDDSFESASQIIANGEAQLHIKFQIAYLPQSKYEVYVPCTTTTRQLRHRIFEDWPWQLDESIKKEDWDEDCVQMVMSGSRMYSPAHPEALDFPLNGNLIISAFVVAP